MANETYHLVNGVVIYLYTYIFPVTVLKKRK